MTISNETLVAMSKYGGLFVQKLAFMYAIADEENCDKLVATFGDTFARYEEIAKKEGSK